MVHRTWYKGEKMNIRKALVYKRAEEKGRYKRLMGEALDRSFNEAWEIRQEEQDAWNKFKFYSGLMEAIDKVEK